MKKISWDQIPPNTSSRVLYMLGVICCPYEMTKDSLLIPSNIADSSANIIENVIENITGERPKITYEEA